MLLLMSSVIVKVMRLCQCAQNSCLARKVLTSTLQCTAVFEVEIDAVRHFLTVLVRDVWRVEVKERVSFWDDAEGL